MVILFIFNFSNCLEVEHGLQPGYNYLCLLHVWNEIGVKIMDVIQYYNHDVYKISSKLFLLHTAISIIIMKYNSDIYYIILILVNDRI